MTRSLPLFVILSGLVGIVFCAKVLPTRLCNLHGRWKEPLNAYIPGCFKGTGGTTGVPCNPSGNPKFSVNTSAPAYGWIIVGDPLSGIYSTGLYTVSPEGLPGPNLLATGFVWPSTASDCPRKNGCWDFLLTSPYTSITWVVSADCKAATVHPLGNASAPELFPANIKE